MKPTTARTLVLSAVLAVGPAIVSAHTTIRQTVPADQAVLSASPASIEITFEHTAQLTSVVVVAEGQAERKLRFEPVGSALKFTLPEPRLTAGRNVLHWKGLSSDGHVIEGTFAYVIAPAHP